MPRQVYEKIYKIEVPIPFPLLMIRDGMPSVLESRRFPNHLEPTSPPNSLEPKLDTHNHNGDHNIHKADDKCGNG